MLADGDDLLDAGQQEQYAPRCRTAMGMLRLNPLNCLSDASYKPLQYKDFSGQAPLAAGAPRLAPQGFLNFPKLVRTAAHG